MKCLVYRVWLEFEVVAKYWDGALALEKANALAEGRESLYSVWVEVREEVAVGPPLGEED